MAKKMTLDNLAGMIQRGFAETAKDFGNVKKDLTILSENNVREHEEIMLCLNDVAHRFELVELQK
ncbi:MAG: hypothetical protein A2174_02925 [Candidatus Portnoybacteria bacterium RBG_13_41_18]|uniref:Uncharacterized protein n=1 Tax=Candidatus Portnoybacteria bacterium RBG_13_41_18 TaxID=1801991 RepID=A0A1G2FA98_9BACT|nr:MAG: hypothetical protein A2174_02925 [Candidatus Portnoybacteria bacterium RBG_13_41_18]